MENNNQNNNINTLYKELQERQEYLKIQEKNTQEELDKIKGRLAENTLTIVRLQQMLLDELNK
jgi:hypothetical protein